MASKRSLIRDKIVGLLKSQTAASDRVYNGRLIPFEKTEIPLINVISMDEAVEEGSPGHGRYHLARRLTVGVLCVVKAGSTDEILDTLDSLCDQVEAVLKADKTLGGLVTDFYYAGTDAPQIESDTSKPFAFATVNYTINYIKS